MNTSLIAALSKQHADAHNSAMPTYTEVKHCVLPHVLHERCDECPCCFRKRLLELSITQSYDCAHMNHDDIIFTS